MSRLIDADELEKAIYKWMPKDMESWADSDIPPIEDLVVSIMMTIQEQPTVNQWTPTSEGLPKERERVLICLDAPINQICISQRVDTNYWIGQGRVNVLAWQPLPKAFEAKEE